MRELLLDGAEWRSKDDFFDSFFCAVGAPSWHGRNFNALIDSICTGQINAIEVPYRVVIQHYSQVSVDARQLADDFIALLRELADQGCAVKVRVDDL